jgi:hypothetical protein
MNAANPTVGATIHGDGAVDAGGVALRSVSQMLASLLI